jgi:hypothetical protein
MKTIGYTYHANIYCGQCGEKLPNSDPEGNDKHPVFSTDELGYADCETGDFIHYFCVECFAESNTW